MNKKKLLLIIGGAVLLVAAIVLSVVLLRNAGAGSIDKPITIGSAGDFKSWFGPGKGLSKKDNGIYYFKLTGDITVKEEGIIAANHAVIDLDGHTLEGKDSRVFAMTGGGLTIQNGSVQTNGAPADGGVFHINGAGCVLNLKDVKVSNTDDSTVPARLMGGVIYATSPIDGAASTINLEGSTTVTGSPSGLRRNGGAVTLEGNTEMYLYDNATIQGGKASVSGNVYLDDISVLYMMGGAIQDGTAVKDDPTSGFGGNVMLQAKSRMYMYGGTISGGNAEYHGGNVFLSNTAQHEGQAGLYLYGGTIQGGYAFADGGNIYITEAASCLYAYGGVVENGDAMRGANVYIEGGALELRGGSLMGNPNSDSTVDGGNIYANKGRVAIYDGIVDKGTATTCGGNIYVSGGSFDMYGGIIRGGTVASKAVSSGGGNVYISGKATARMFGGEILDGVSNCLNDEDSSAAGGNLMIASSAYMEMFGGLIKNGTVHGAITRGGGVYVYGQVKGNNTVFHMYGGTIENGPTDNKMRGMCIGAYSETNGDGGFGTARVFDGELIFTGKTDDPNRIYTIHGNKTHGRDMVLYDPTGYEGMYNRTTTGACTDPTHNTKTGQEAATCLTHGYTVYTCDTCGTWCQITEEPTGHTEQTQTRDDGLTEHSCTACQEVRYTRDEE